MKWGDNYDVADLTNVIHTNMIASTIKQITKRLDKNLQLLPVGLKSLTYCEHIILSQI